MMKIRFSAGWLPVMVLVGCGKVSGIPIDETATAFAQAICPKAYACCTAQQLMGNAAAGASEPECEAKTTQSFQQQLQAMQDSENAGRAQYDQGKVDACLAAIRAATCADLTAIRSLSQLPACDVAFARPQVSAGGKCQQDYECIGGVCQRQAGSFDGICGAGAPAGASCATNRCASRLVCDGEATMDASDHVCVAAADNGAPCSDAAGCNSRYCANDPGTGSKTCQTPPQPQCFYGGGCSTPGGRPAAGGLLLLLAMAASRRRRARFRAGSNAHCSTVGKLEVGMDVCVGALPSRRASRR